MSKITFRADDDLVDRIEALDASKSEVMREALRAYLDSAERSERETSRDTRAVDDALATRIDELISARLDDALDNRARRTDGMSVTVTVDGVQPGNSATLQPEEPVDGVRKTPDDTGAHEADGVELADSDCVQCGESIDGDHVYCPNCGEKASHRTFCECGDEIRSDWAFCPACGRRTPAADVLDNA